MSVYGWQSFVSEYIQKVYADQPLENVIDVQSAVWASRGKPHAACPVSLDPYKVEMPGFIAPSRSWFAR